MIGYDPDVIRIWSGYDDLSYWYKMALKKSKFSYIVMIANRAISVNGWQNLQALIPYVMM